jgi:SAM-dependent methyltransferase
MTLRDGVWFSLPIERAAYFSRFISEYEMIRAAEGRGSLKQEYYLDLPYRDRTGNNKWQWKIRACTYKFLKKNIFPALKVSSSIRPRILDIGSGNGWLSFRLAQMAFSPVAIDLLANDHDGLGAASNYESHLSEMFPRFQAESTRLPFTDGQFDAVIFNASFHYAESYEKCLGEALRCLKPGGLVIIADSPWYSQEKNGERMLAERHKTFLNRFGTLSNSIPSLEFLTDERLAALEAAFGIKWTRYVPFYGIRWALRPLIARLRNRREPAMFRIYTARKPA